MTEEDPIDKMNKPELERLARRYWAFANTVAGARDFHMLRDLMASYFRGMAEDLRGQFIEANRAPDAASSEEKK